MQNNFLMGVKFWTSWGSLKNFSKSYYWDDFFKNGLQLVCPRGYFWDQISELFFFNLRYIKGGVRGNNNIGIKKCTTIFLWVLNFGEVGEILENFQKHPLGESFWKIFSKVWFWKNFTKDFPVKNEEFFFSKIFM